MPINPPRKFFKILLPVAFCLLFAFALSGCKAIGTNKPAALQVTSKPEASVFLDGKHIGKTPFFSDQLKSGKHLLKVTVADAAYVEKINLKEGTLTVVNRELNNNFMAQSGETLWLEPGMQGLFVISMPSEADLTLDGKFLGKTPFLIAKIEDGEYKIELSKDGYIKREFPIKTSSKYQLVADVTLASELAKDVGPQASAVPQPPVQKIEVLKTPQGFLRVRQEPSLTSQEVGRVATGDQLEIIQEGETKDWIKIKFGDKQGWISAQYTKKL